MKSGNASMTDKAYPFAGLRVVDFSSVVSGPHCTSLLCSMGAEVIKIEPPEGEMLRDRPPMRGGASAFYGHMNGGKRCIALDLKAPKAIDIVKRLVARADILVENFRPGVMKRLGLDYDSVKALKPDLIYCSISGYGQSGPSAGKAAYAPVVHASSGYDMAHLSYQEGREKPDVSAIYVADVISGTYAMGAIATALYHRRATGEGQSIDVSMMEATLSVLVPDIEKAQFPAPQPIPRALSGAIRCRDGYVMMAPASERNFQALAKAMDREDWLTDPRFATFAERRLNTPVLAGIVADWASTRLVVDVEALWESHGVPCSRFRTVGEALDDPQLAHRDAIVEMRDSGGAFRSVHPPFRISGLEARTRPDIADIGADADSILAELDYATADVTELRTSGVLK